MDDKGPLRVPKHLYKPPPLEGKIISPSPIDTLDFLLFSASFDAIFGLKQSLYSLCLVLRGSEALTGTSRTSLPLTERSPVLKHAPRVLD